MRDQFFISSVLPDIVEVQSVSTQTSNFGVTRYTESGYTNTFFKKKMSDFFNRRSADLKNLNTALDKALRRASV